MPGEQSYLGVLDLDGRILLKLILKKQDGMEWIPLAKIRDRWVTVVNMVIMLWAA